MRPNCRGLVTLLASMAVIGCQFDRSGIADDGASGGADAADGDGARAIDAAMIDASSVDAADSPDAVACAAWTFVPSNVDECDPALPDPMVALELTSLGTHTYDSTTSELSGPDGTRILPSVLMAQPGGVMVRVVPLGALTVGSVALFRLRGAHPIVFVVHGEATITGTIDLSGEIGVHGPGGGTAGDCSGGDGTAGGTATNATSGAGGGGGGAFGEAGGDGGDGHGSGKGAKGAKGAKNGNDSLSPLRGGCGGGVGGNAIAAPGGTFGGGGGGLQISARDRIDHSGTITAAGGGGAGGGALAAVGRAGGGGGGSGGAIFLESDVIALNIASRLCANGGSGGEGSDATSAGANGASGTCDETAVAQTINLLPNGGDGGNGSSESARSGSNASNGSAGSGGGGGGGGVGRIRLRAVSTLDDGGSNIVSPAAFAE